MKPQVKTMIRRVAGAVAVSIGLVLATGLWLPAQAALTDFGFDSPGDGEITSSRVVPVQMRAESDAPKGLQSVKLRISGSGFEDRVVWCAPGTAPNCSSWGQGTQTYRGTFNWDTRSLTQYNGNFTLKLIVTENGGGPAERSIGVQVNTPPATPSWESVTPTTSNGRPAMTLRWRANSEPDITQYQITRPAAGGGTVTFNIDATSPGSQGCSLSGGYYTCLDAQYPASGYGGTYTYYISAKRSSPVSSGGVRSGQAARSATINEPRPSSGGGGPRPGPGTRPPPGNPGSAPAPGSTPAPGLTPTPDPFAARPEDFNTGTFKPTLPYRNPNALVKVLGERKARAAGFTEEVEVPLDVRRTLLPIAGGLFTVTAAMHFRRVLRDSH